MTQFTVQSIVFLPTDFKVFIKLVNFALKNLFINSVKIFKYI